MLLIAFALQSATVAMAAAELPRPRIARATLRRSARPVPETSPLLTTCAARDACGERSTRSRFRLTSATDAVIDRKLEMVRAATGPSCGLVGMPVCPARGRQILRLGY